ncbi:hypothetical protein [Mycobacterium sp. 155]|uniref:hypothetical protein n=1 Tax=Mycobacterium sp. 155 TaxID=1157943 RepID=UPI00035FA6DD|nr:hypothetical protein [Mycobacterium sp. 155]
MSTDSPSHPEPSLGALQELRTLAAALREVDAAATAAEWGDDAALAVVARRAATELALLPQIARSDVAAAGASPQWLTRIEDYAHGVSATRGLTPTPEEAAANVVVAVRLARAAIAEAVTQVALAHRVIPEASLIGVIRDIGPVLHGLRRDVGAEVRHIVFDRPRTVLLRVVITLGTALGLVGFYHLTGWTRYDAGRLTLYLFSAVVGSVICTNALCFEAERVRHALSDGGSIWRILVTKNLAIAAMVIGAGLPVIAVLTATQEGNPIAMFDQLLTMVFIWLGVGNVLSVVFPLRQEPVSARLHDGTWRSYLFSFAVSYGVGLTVNLMIYWRLWSRQTAADELVGGDWAAFVLVLLSAVTSWALLTVFAAACSREPRLRGLLSREMVTYRAS